MQTLNYGITPIGKVWSLHLMLMVPQCCVIKLACTMQKTQLPVWVMGAVYNRFEGAPEGARKGPCICYVSN